MTKFLRAALILMVISASLVYAQDNIYLGHGKNSDYINLDEGALVSGYNPFNGMTGFAALSTPQTMALSPGIMVYQAKKLMDESNSLKDENAEILNKSKSLRDETAEILNKSKSVKDENAGILDKTQEIANQVQDTSNRIDALAGQIQKDSEDVAGYASSTKDYYRKAQSLNNETIAALQLVSNLTQMNEKMAAKIDAQVSDSASYAASARDSLNETRSIYNRVNSTAVEINALITGQDDFMEANLGSDN